MAKQWRCFHCDEIFYDLLSAREHFGSSQMHEPACQINIAKFREMERRVELCDAEDSDLHRAIHKAECEGRQAARRAEETGYARGLADGLDISQLMVPPSNEKICAIGAAASLCESMGNGVIAKHLREFLEDRAKA
jgi:hypothetical protein